MKARLIGTAAVAATVTLLAALPLVTATRATAAMASVTFGQPFRLVNPANPFVFGVQDVEPSVRVDTLGNVFPGAIRGVPAGVDVWRVFPPYDSSHYEYLGSPDGTPPIPGPGPNGDKDPGVASGGGDIDIASSCGTNVLNVSSLNLATTTNFRSADQGHHFAVTAPSSSTYTALDRQWYDNDGPFTVYQSVHDTAAGNAIVVTRSTNGGIAWSPVPGQVINPAQPDAFAAALPLNNRLGNIVVDQHRHYLYQVYSAGADPADNVNGAALRAVWVAVSLDQGLTWTDHRVFAAASDTMRTDDVFPSIAVDDGGNVYTVWSESDTNDPTNHPGTFFSSSTDFGATWSPPVKVNQGTSQNLTLFPWIDAAGDGGVDIVYYGTSANINGGDAVWNVFMAQSRAAHASNPGFTTFQVTGTGPSNPPIHQGNISTGGLQPPGTTADRSLADLFQVAVGYDGLANISWAADWYNRANPGDHFDGQAWFVHQTSGGLQGKPNDGCHAFTGSGGGGGGVECHEGDGEGDVQGNRSGTAHFQSDEDSCKDGDQNTVRHRDPGAGEDFQSTKIDSVQFDNVAHTVMISGLGVNAGSPVSFFVIEQESSNGVPGWFSISLSDGYTNAGNLINGAVTLR